jgi:hypothetical protein
MHTSLPRAIVSAMLDRHRRSRHFDSKDEVYVKSRDHKSSVAPVRGERALLLLEASVPAC